MPMKAVPFLHLPAICPICGHPFELWLKPRPDPFEGMTQIRHCVNGHFVVFDPATNMLVMITTAPDTLSVEDLVDIQDELKNGHDRAPPGNAAPVITGKITVRVY